MRSTKLIALPIALVSSPLFARDQSFPVPAHETGHGETQGSEIVVTAGRIRGEVEAPQPPVATLNEEDIAALGASSVSDIIARISPQTTSGRGRGGGAPVVLVNGLRISNLRELRNFPSEAIRRVDVLPEEVALRFGYPPDQRVINLILKDSFASKSIELQYGQPDRGGSHTSRVELSRVRIAGPKRFSVTGTFNDTSPLTEAERGIVQTPGTVPSVSGDPDPARFRTLISDSSDASLNTSWSRGLGKDGTGGQISLNATATRSDSRSQSGLDVVRLVAPDGSSALRTIDDPLERRTRVTTLQGGAGFNGLLGTWQLSATLDATHNLVEVGIDRSADTLALVAAAAAGTLAIDGPLPTVASAGEDRARIASDSATSLVTLIGRPVRLPAGEAAATVKAGFAYTGIDSSDTRSGNGSVNLKRGDLSGGINLGLPLTSRREGVLGAIGDLTLNLSAGIDHLSDFGTLTDWSAGLTWGVTSRLGLQASYIYNQAAPSLNELGNPLTVSLNYPIYDFARSETVLVNITTGGNPALRREVQRDLKLSANWQLPFLSNSSVIVEYFHNRSSDVTAAFPLLTPTIEAAFPGRVTRDSSGRLVAIDARSVTLAEQTSSRLRWGFNFSGQFGKAEPGGGRAPQTGAGRPGGRPGPGALLGGDNRPRWSLGLYHTVQFSSRVLVAPGGPVLDLLGGDALSGGATPRHSLEFNGRLFGHGLGLFFQGSYAAPTTVRASGLPGSSNLHFGALAKTDLRLFADLDLRTKLVEAVPFLKGTRVALRIDNLFDEHQKVTDASGSVPFSYQPDRLDPRGRFIGVELRKMF